MNSFLDCPYCKKKNFAEINLIAHVIDSHPTENSILQMRRDIQFPNKCPICTSKSTDLSGYLRHCCAKHPSHYSSLKAKYGFLISGQKIILITNNWSNDKNLQCEISNNYIIEYFPGMQLDVFSPLYLTITSQIISFLERLNEIIYLSTIRTINSSDIIGFIISDRNSVAIMKLENSYEVLSILYHTERQFIVVFHDSGYKDPSSIKNQFQYISDQRTFNIDPYLRQTFDQKLHWYFKTNGYLFEICTREEQFTEKKNYIMNNMTYIDFIALTAIHVFLQLFYSETFLKPKSNY